MADQERLCRLERACRDMQQLARGVHPRTGEALPASLYSALCDSFACAADTLRLTVENAGRLPGEAAPKAEFAIAPEQLALVPVTAAPATLQEIAQRVNARVDLSRMEGLPVAALSLWLYENGFLTEAEGMDGSRRRIPSVRGNRVGIRSELREGPGGRYTAALCDENAQRLLLDNLHAMLAAYRRKKRELDGNG